MPDDFLEYDYEDRNGAMVDDLDDYDLEPIYCDECGEEFASWYSYDAHTCVLTD